MTLRSDCTAPMALAAVAGRLTGGRVDVPLRPGDLLACARENRVHLLLAGTLRHDDPDDEALWVELQDEYREAAARDAGETAALQQLFAIASQQGVRPLLFKGAALARRLYPRSWERPRMDVDLFISEADARVMCRVLETAGYQRATAVDGALVTQQFQYRQVSPGRLDQQIDVHTRLFNPAAFAHALEWSDADACAVDMPALGPSARTVSDADALFVACLHRVAHHHGEPDLIWIYDIDRLARRLGPEAWAMFVSRAAAARVRAVCHNSLAAAMSLFRTPIPATVTASLAPTDLEPSAAFLHRGAGELQVQWLNLQHLPGWRARAALVLQHLFPSREYMRTRYGVKSGWMLPLCYVRRLCAGVPRWLGLQRS